MIYKFFYFYFIKIFNHLRNIFTFQYQKISELKSYLQVQSSSSILLFKKRFIYFCHQTTLCYRLILFQFLLVIAITNMSHQLSKNSPQIHYKLQQILGVDEHPEHVHEEDIITSIQFDQSGGYLAIGDQAGRVIIFSSEQHSELQFLDLHNKSEKPQQLNYYGQFQSHVQQFDCLKSIPVNKSIKSINWLKPQGKYKKMITSNCQQIKLWKMHQKQEKKVIKSSGQHMQMPHLHTQQKSFVAISKLQFPVCHKGQINFVNISKNQQYLLSTDQKTALLWSLQNSHKPTIVEDINSKIGNNRWKEGQQISCSKYHPIVDSTFMIGSTKGRLELSDLRISFTNRNNLSFTCSKEKKQQNYFTDLVCRTSSIQFLRGGKYVVSRDYLTIKIWDICNVSKPINIINVNQTLKEKLCDLFENDCFDDDFSLMAISGRNCDGGGEAIATGSYNNRFNLIDPISGNNMEYELNFSKQTKRFPLHEVKNNFRSAFNHKKKTLYHSINPISHKIAVASLNSFFVYRPEELGRTKQNY